MKIVEYKFTSSSDVRPVFNNGETYSWTYSDTTNSDGTTTRIINADVAPTKISFKNKKGLKHVGYVCFNSIEDASEMFRNCTGLISIDGSEWNLTNVENFSYIFDGCTSLTSVNLDDLSTAYIEDVSYMFANCTNLSNVSLKNWNALNIYDCSNMFYYCKSIKNIDLSSWTNFEIARISNMFYGCTNLETVDISNIELGDHGSLSGAFGLTDKLTNIIMTNSDIESVSLLITVLNDRSTFSTPGNLFLSIDTMDLDSSSISQLNWRVYNSIACYEATSSSVVPTFNSGYSYSTFSTYVGSYYKNIIYNTSSNVPSTINFNGKSITNVYYVNTSGLTSMASMFTSCTSLIYVNMSGWDVDNVTTMNSLFKGCTSLTTVVGLESLNVASLTNLASMFENCSSISKISGFNRWNTNIITNVSRLFYGCKKLHRINLSNMDLSNASTTNMFETNNTLKYVVLCNVPYTSINNIISYLPSRSSGYGATLFTNTNLTNVNTSAASSKNWNTTAPNKLAEYIFPRGEECILPTFNKNFIEYEYKDVLSGNTPFLRRTVYAFDSFPTRMTLSGGTNIVSVPYINIDNLSELTAMFQHCSSLAEIDLSYLDVSHIRSLSSVFLGCTSLKTVNLSNWNIVNVETMIGMFEDCSSLQTITGIANLNTSNVESMGSIFSGCSSLTNVNISNWITNKVTTFDDAFKNCNLDNFTGIESLNTSSATSMYGMFHHATTTKPLNLTNFDTSNVKSINYMFSYTSCPSLNLSGLDVSKVKYFNDVFFNSDIPVLNMNGWNLTTADKLDSFFMNCKNTTTLTVDNWTFNDNLTSIRALFWGCSKLESIDLSTWTLPTSVETASEVFAFCYNLKTVTGTERIITSNVKNISGFFNSCFVLESANETGWDCTNVEKMTNVFNYCRALTSINLSSANITKATSFASLFNNCISLENVNLTNVKSRNVTSVSSMFEGCSKLTTITGLDKLDLSKCTDFYGMFMNSPLLTNINLSRFGFNSNVSNVKKVFKGCSSLATLDISNWEIPESVVMTEFFEGATNLSDVRINNVSDAMVNKVIELLPRKDSMASGVLYINNEMNNINISVANSKYWAINESVLVAEYRYLLDTTINTPTFNTGFEDYSYSSEPEDGTYGIRRVYAYNDDFTSMKLTGNGIVDIFYIDTRDVTSAYQMFAYSSNLKSVDLSEWDSSKITTFYGMFLSCGKLTTITGMDNLDTGEVNTVRGMFKSCTSLTNVDCSKWNDTSKITNVREMFYKCSSLVTVNLKGWTAPLTDMQSMFEDCSSLTTITGLNTLNTAGLTTLRNTFYGCSSLTNISGLSGFNTSNVTSLYQTFRKCSSLISLDLSNWNTASVTSSSSIFKDATALNKIILTNCEVATINTIIGLLPTKSSDNRGSIYLNISPSSVDQSTANSKYWDVYLSNVIAKYTFLPSVKDALPTFNSGFSYSYSDSSISDTEVERVIYSEGKPTTIKFNNQSSITEISFIDITGVTSLQQAFTGCSNLTYIDTSYWDTSKITSFNGIFINCKALTEIDLSGFDLSSATTIASMFNGCSALTTIDFSGIKNQLQTISLNAIFNNCSSLTTIRGLDKFKNANNLGNMFYGCKALTEIDISCFDTTTITTAASLFFGCSALKKVNVSNLKLNVTSMASMFSGCSSLTDIIGFDTWTVGTSACTATTMFNGCSALTNLDLSHWNVSVSGKSCKSMFNGCTNLIRLNISGWDFSMSSNVDTFFSGATALNMIVLEECGLDCINTIISGLNARTSSDPGFLVVDEGMEELVDVTTANSLYWYLSSQPILLTKYVFNSDVDTIPSLPNSYKTYYYKDVRSVYNGTTERSFYVVNTRPRTATFFNKPGLLELLYFDATGMTTLTSLFTNCKFITSVDLSVIVNSSNVTNLNGLFSGCTSLTQVSGLSNLITSKVTNIGAIFNGCTALTSISLVGCDTSGVTTTSYLFFGCENATTINLSGINLENVKTVSTMFANCKSLTTITGLSSIKITKATALSSLFSNCSSLTNLDLSHWKTDVTTNMSAIFKGCSSLKSVNISTWDTSNVTTITSMFEGCSSLTSIDFKNLVLYKLTSLNKVFKDCSALTTLDLSTVCTRNVTKFSEAFSGCTNLTSLNLSGWYIDGETTSMFDDCDKLSNIIIERSNSLSLNNIINILPRLEDRSCSIHVNNLYNVDYGKAYYNGYDLKLYGDIACINNKKTNILGKKFGGNTAIVKLHIGGKTL